MSDIQQLTALYSICFPDDPADFWNWIFKTVYAPENTMNVRRDGRIVASLQMIPCKMKLNDALYDAHYIYAAATHPEYRDRGLMAGLLEAAAAEGARRGHWFSVLITQEDSLLEYYARFGYRPKLLYGRGVPGNAGKSGMVSAMCTADLPEVAAIYETEAAGTLHGYRDIDDWQLQLDLFGDGAVVWRQDGHVLAYAFKDERGVIEAAGPMADVLCAGAVPGKAWRTLPTKNGVPMGSIKPLNEKALAIMEQNRCFLNLMFN